LVPGENVLVDAWQVHVVTLDVTREEWARMTEEQRRKVKKVRRWIVVFIDVATRLILGFALCC
jgi:putative transposase